MQFSSTFSLIYYLVFDLISISEHCLIIALFTLYCHVQIQRFILLNCTVGNCCAYSHSILHLSFRRLQNVWRASEEDESKQSIHYIRHQSVVWLHWRLGRSELSCVSIDLRLKLGMLLVCWLFSIFSTLIAGTELILRHTNRTTKTGLRKRYTSCCGARLNKQQSKGIFDMLSWYTPLKS